MTFSIDGASQESYVSYRPARRVRRRRSQPARRWPTRSAERPRRAVPQLALHPLHLERQRRGDGAGARAGGRHRRRSPVLGAHRSPRGHVLAALRAGIADLDAIRHEVWDDNNLGNAIPGATPRAEIDVRAVPARCRSSRGAAGRRRCRPRVRTCPRGRSARRPATAGGSSASARSSATSRRIVINRDYERAWLPRDVEPGARPTSDHRGHRARRSRAATR